MPTIKTRKVIIRDADFSVFVILYELNHPPSDDDFPFSSTERPTIDPSQILRPSCRFSLEVCTKLHSSTFAGMVGRPKESRTTTTYFLMGFGRELKKSRPPLPSRSRRSLSTRSTLSSKPNLRPERNRACHQLVMRSAGIAVWRGRSCDKTGA